MNNMVIDHQETRMRDSVNFTKLATKLAETGKNFYSRGWVLGTSGNLGAVTSWQPLRLAISPTGLDKGSLTAAHFLEIDGACNVIRGDGRPSTETMLHLAIIGCMNAGAVLHTHSVRSTVLSNMLAPRGGVAIEGYEMLKGLMGVRTHEHREWLPILNNSQDTSELSQNVSSLCKHSGIHGLLLRGHGLYSWGTSLQEAKRHIEILEFLMEVLVRSHQSVIQGELG
ncbi:MAG: methylthioribulose 1-phosphate dehydratase [Candidatus Nitrosopolaris sp.]